MDEVKKLAAKDGLNIEVVEFNDFVTPNIALQQGEIFANSMQHRPYLDATLKKEPGFELVEVFKTVNFPMAVYSDKIKKVKPSPTVQPSASRMTLPTAAERFCCLPSRN